MRNPPPARRKAIRGKQRSVVTLTDYATHQRKDYTLGDWDTPVSRQAYARLIAEWEARGRRLAVPDSLTVVEVAAEYRRWADGYYSKGEASSIRLVLLVASEMYGRIEAERFGVGEFRAVRDAMIRKGWSRRYINVQCQRLRAGFKWAAGRGMIPATVYLALGTVEPLKKGRTTAPDLPPVRPVTDAEVEAIEPFVSRQVWAIVQLQRLTGARGGEILTLKRGDLVGVDDRRAKVWTTRVAEHKMERFGKRRSLYFGPRAQAVLRPWIMRPTGAYMFSPAESRPGVSGPRKPGARYTNTSYSEAIERACDRAWPLPADLARGRVQTGPKRSRWETLPEWRARLGSRWPEVEEWQTAHRWHPHQLRHAAATEFRQRYGLEAAQILLGHSSALVTDAVYAERDEATALRVAREIG